MTHPTIERPDWFGLGKEIVIMNRHEMIERIDDATAEADSALDAAGYLMDRITVERAAWLIVADDDWTSTDIAEALINNMGLSYNRSGNTITVEPNPQTKVA